MPKPTTLIKTQRVLEMQAVETPDEPVTFVQYEDDHGFLTTAVTISATTWRDMGCPDKLTVTLEPGDLLNAPERPEITSTSTYIGEIDD